MSEVTQAVKDLIAMVDSAFEKRYPILSLWQEIADNFYPQRADFTTIRPLGTDFASHLTTSYPLLMHRSLSDMISGMLRPRSEIWGEMSIQNEDALDAEGKRWLERNTKAMHRAMYDPTAGFVRATKEGDADFVAFGQTVIQNRLNNNLDGMLFKCHHLRDTVWFENSAGVIDIVGRKIVQSAADYAKYFPIEKLHQKMVKAIQSTKDRKKPFKCLHIFVDKEYYQPEKFRNFRWVSLYVDVENNHVIEAVGTNANEYTIPRWQTVSGSQYAYSPCTIAALPDARLIQSMSLVLLEAGEIAVKPPMLATHDAIRGDINLYSSGITWVDREYDERAGAALQAIETDLRGIPFGMELREDIKQQILEAFYLNKINLPPMTGQMTAFEVSQRVQEYVRGALPLFEPMEVEYNGGICLGTFEHLMPTGLFGGLNEIPESLQGQQLKFNFKSPLNDAAKQESAKKFMEARTILAEAAMLDPNSVRMFRVEDALRDVLGDAVSNEWVYDEREFEAIKQQAMADQQQAQQMAQMQQGAQIAETAGKAMQTLA